MSALVPELVREPVELVLSDPVLVDSPAPDAPEDADTELEPSPALDDTEGPQPTQSVDPANSAQASREDRPLSMPKLTIKTNITHAACA